ILVESTEGSKEIRGLLRQVLDEQLDRLKACVSLQGVAKPTTKDLLAAGREIRERLDSGQRSGPVYTAATAQAVAMKVNHAIELAETQGMESLRAYLDRVEEVADHRAGRT